MDSPTLDIIERLKKGETIEYGYLGVMIRNPSELESKTAGAEPNTGAFVHTVEPSGPAHKAGVMEADMIVAIDGKPVKDSDDMVTSVGRMPVGKEVALTIYRSGKKMELKAPVGRRPGGKVASTGGRKGKPVPAGSFEWRGLTLRELTPEVRGEAEAGKEAAGVYVDRVDEKSGAYERGIHGGMIIDQVASIKVKNLEEFKKAVEKIKGPVFVNVIGQGPLVVPEE
jgi:serine protease Do